MYNNYISKSEEIRLKKEISFYKILAIIALVMVAILAILYYSEHENFNYYRYSVENNCQWDYSGTFDICK